MTALCDWVIYKGKYIYEKLKILLIKLLQTI